MSKDDELGLIEPTETENGSGAPKPAALELDVTNFAADLKSFDLSEEQEVELLATLWSIMRSMVELGFSVKLCGQLFEDFNFVADDMIDELDSSATSNSEKGLRNGKVGPR